MLNAKLESSAGDFTRSVKGDKILCFERNWSVAPHPSMLEQVNIHRPASSKDGPETKRRKIRSGKAVALGGILADM